MCSPLLQTGHVAIDGFKAVRGGLDISKFLIDSAHFQAMAPGIDCARSQI